MSANTIDSLPIYKHALRVETMTTLTKPKQLSASEVSRRLQTPLGRFLRAVHEGFIQPDTIALDGRLFLFNETRLEEITQRLEAIEHQPAELANA